MKKVYNIYYKGDKINKLPLDEESIKNIYSKEFVYKRIGNKNQKINLKNTFIRECIVI